MKGYPINFDILYCLEVNHRSYLHLRRTNNSLGERHDHKERLTGGHPKVCAPHGVIKGMEEAGR